MSSAFHFEERGDGIGLLTLDLPDKKVNTLSQATLMELGGVLAKLKGRPELRGLLFRSGKPGQFIAGADLNELGALAFADKEQVGQAVAMGHHLYGLVARLPFPTVALVDGHCMGGGTELILAMDDRIVSNASHTKIGLPETKIGIIPGWGGTQRLPRLIGLNAIEIICTGEPISAAKAVEVGLAFDAGRRGQARRGGRPAGRISPRDGPMENASREASRAARPEPRPARLRVRDRRGGGQDEDEGPVPRAPRGPESNP